MSTSEGEKTEESKNDLLEETTSPPVIETETPSGLNGDKEMDIDENTSEDNKETESSENTEEVKKAENELDEDPIPSRKRKYNDLGELSDDSSSADFLGFPDTRTEEEKRAAAAKKEKQEKVKQDLLAFNAEAFGKGKRSRVPNKRYEGTIRSFSKSSNRHNENLDNDNAQDITDDGRHYDGNDLHKDDDISSTHSSPRVKSRVAASPAKKPRMIIDMSNPKYLKPFEFGWKRELVYRATLDNNMRRNGDIYYYAPTGKKVRSMRELIDTLKIDKSTELTSDDFTFFKEPVGINDPEKEIIREANYKNATLLKTGLKAKSTRNSSSKVAATSESSTKNTKSPKLGGFKVKLSGSSKLNQGSNKKDKRASADSEMEIGMLPPAWSPKKGSSAKQSIYTKNQAEATPPKTRRSGLNRKTPTVSAPVVKTDVESRFMQNYLQNLSYGYQTLLYVFQYLKVQDLLRAGCVCTLWRDIAGHPSLWNTVRMKNSQVANWEGLADALKKHRTKNLDLRKMLLPNTGDDMWAQFSKAIERVDSLVRIELCRCPASVIEQLATTNKNLQVINAVMIRCESMDISSLNNLENLQELKLKSTNGFVLTSDLTPLKKLTKLKHLSLTSIKDLNKQNVQVIGDLINLETLDLGECSDFPENFGTDVITKLTKLEKLRLEKGQGSCCTFNILDAVGKIPCLEQLELVNFDVKAGFDKALGACANIKKLLIIPTYISQSATTNHMVLGGVIKLKSTLSHFVWGVTLELLRVTELFVDQCEDSPSKDKKKPTGNGDSIPVLKPVPIMKTDEIKDKDDSPSKEQPQVEILPLPTLQKLLLNCLPTTRVKILKIPFHATWRQSIVDTVN